MPDSPAFHRSSASSNAGEVATTTRVLRITHLIMGRSLSIGGVLRHMPPELAGNQSAIGGRFSRRVVARSRHSSTSYGPGGCAVRQDRDEWRLVAGFRGVIATSGIWWRRFSLIGDRVVPCVAIMLP